MCSDCNKSFSEFISDPKYKYLDREDIQLLLLRDILKALHSKED